MKRLLIVVALAVFAVPAALAVPPGTAADSSQDCKAQRRAMGMAGFQSTYAPNGKPKAAMDACLAKQSQLASTDAKNAAKACKAERDSLGVAAFSEKYGNKKNAFGVCVSTLAGTLDDEQQDATLNAAKKCKAERVSLGVAAFNEKYGNKKNAFGKCVSKNAKPATP